MSFFGKVIRYLQEEGLFSEGGGKRKLTGGFDLSLKVFCAIYSLYFLYTTFFGLVSQETHVGFYFLGTFVISFTLFKAGPRSPQNRMSVFDILFILVMTAIIIYYIVEYPKLAERMGSGVKTIDAVLGWCIILLSLEMARRTVGNIIPTILYYASVAVIIRLEAVKQDLKGLPASELPKFGDVLREIHLLLPIPILIVLLAFEMTPFIAGLFIGMGLPTTPSYVILVILGVPYMELKLIAANTEPGENGDKPRKAFFRGQYWVCPDGS